MKRFALPALLFAVVALAGQCDRNSPPPPIRSSFDAITIRGKEVSVVPLAKYDERRHAVQQYIEQEQKAGILLMYAKSRSHSLYFEIGPVGRTVMAAFIDADRKIVDVQPLIRGKRGITSAVETPFALVIDTDTFVASGAAKGDAVAFSAALDKIRPDPLPVVRIGDVSIDVELSTSYNERQRGLMCRSAMSESDGMLFAYPSESERSFWMGFCLMPISIAYIKSDGAIATIHHDMLMYKDPMDPKESDPRYPSKVPVQYVLEVTHGFFKKHGIAEGMKVTFPRELERYLPE
ncbi:MAG TPA: DUF192 domain-containing protein [Planctomycetota bacterium]|nr:DUF192 domain-containing protein [Planctomycetota bacterium]